MDGHQWRDEMARKLKEKGPAPVLQALQALNPRGHDQQEILRKAVEYFTTNTTRMNYPDYAAIPRLNPSAPVSLSPPAASSPACASSSPACAGLSPASKPSSPWAPCTSPRRPPGMTSGGASPSSVVLPSPH